MTDPSEVTLATFAERTGQQVSVAEVEGLELEVLEAVERTVGPDASAGSAFSVLFAGPADPALPQGMVTLADDELVLPVFLVPLGPAAGDRIRYEAVYTRTG